LIEPLVQNPGVSSSMGSPHRAYTVLCLLRAPGHHQQEVLFPAFLWYVLSPC
jgi:hypothetical protein